MLILAWQICISVYLIMLIKSKQVAVGRLYLDSSLLYINNFCQGHDATKSINPT